MASMEGKVPTSGGELLEIARPLVYRSQAGLGQDKLALRLLAALRTDGLQIRKNVFSAGTYKPSFPVIP